MSTMCSSFGQQGRCISNAERLSHNRVWFGFEGVEPLGSTEVQSHVASSGRKYKDLSNDDGHDRGFLISE